MDVLSKKLSIKEEKLQRWIEGEELPTFKQAQKLANALQVPFGYLFLSGPPKEQLPVPDLRTTRKSLSVKEFRGLAISDPYAPLIYVNTADAKSAQIFTLSHELAHLWIGESGVSDLQMFINFDNKIEKFCNEIAAELLVPEDEFKKYYDGSKKSIRFEVYIL